MDSEIIIIHRINPFPPLCLSKLSHTIILSIARLAHIQSTQSDQDPILRSLRLPPHWQETDPSTMSIFTIIMPCRNYS